MGFRPETAATHALPRAALHLPQLQLRDLVAVHLVRAVGDPQRPDPGVIVGASRNRRDTPAPPWAWIAQSITFNAMFGATTLIIAISARAALLPAVSIM